MVEKCIMPKEIDVLNLILDGTHKYIDSRTIANDWYREHISGNKNPSSRQPCVRSITQKISAYFSKWERNFCLTRYSDKGKNIRYLVKEPELQNRLDAIRDGESK